MKYYAILSINACVTEKHVVEDNILFTKPLAGKGLSLLKVGGILVKVSL